MHFFLVPSGSTASCPKKEIRLTKWPTEGQTAKTFGQAWPNPANAHTERSWADIRREVVRMDFLGATLVAGAVTSLILALQWGGNTKAWDDKGVIICFVLSGVLACAYISLEIYLGDRAMTPMEILHSPSVYAIFAYSLLSRFSMMFSYYIPIFYQAARHHSATKSGIDIIPFSIACVLSIIITGQIVSKTGYYWYFLVISPIFLGVGSGLLYTVDTSSSLAAIAGFQIVLGVGVGVGMQNGLLAIQVEFKDKKKLLGQATSMATFCQFLGSTLGLGIAEPVFASELGKYLLQFAPDAPAAIVTQSPMAVYTALPASMIPGVVHAYTAALKIVFVLGVPVAGLWLICAMFIDNIRIEKTAPPKGTAEPDEEKGAPAGLGRETVE
ncbi:hypothetical protein C8R47DRAFT_1267813 [Mycena vitilis]|nr:hypothetical protein C8R47DRAFT_1267813 [Mycena vitilis]